ncbi:hypothetical protein [Bacillus horti]|uniref:Uncharacterized protein n=1 Tax=Caldalkalibacillus horti TaxID=77523 RepID=A0ABT9VZ88_9BACI|nr:hypothetical protein [Bacillus horti]MDQ0166175.1 hypothetical protein [Bacillus horti]
METILTGLIFVLAISMILSEIYKISFERKPESKDERGVLILLKVKNVSYYILLGELYLE